MAVLQAQQQEAEGHFKRTRSKMERTYTEHKVGPAQPLPKGKSGLRQCVLLCESLARQSERTGHTGRMLQDRTAQQSSHTRSRSCLMWSAAHPPSFVMTQGSHRPGLRRLLAAGDQSKAEGAEREDT